MKNRKKAFMAYALSAMIIAASLPVTAIAVAEAESKVMLLGDADESGTIGIADVTVIQKHIAHMTTLEDRLFDVAEIDGDEMITIKDATEIQKYVAGMYSSYPIGQPIGGSEDVTTEPTTAVQGSTSQWELPEIDVTTEPTETPTTQPKVEPTELATTAPATAAPTTQGSTKEWELPEIDATNKPTQAPTTQPKVEPTEAPTTQPKIEPTAAPTTVLPTVAPTTQGATRQFELPEI